MKANGTNNGCSRLNTPLAATTTLEDPGTPASWKGPPPGSEASPFTPNSVGQGGGPGSGPYNSTGGPPSNAAFQGPSPFPGGAGSPAGAPPYQGPPPGSATPQYTASPAPSGSSTPGPGPPPNSSGFPPPPNNSGPPYNGPGPSPFGSPSGGPPQFVGRPGSSGPPFVPPGAGNPHFPSHGQPFGGPQYGMPPGSPFGPGHPMTGPIGPGHPAMMGPGGPVDRIEQGWNLDEGPRELRTQDRNQSHWRDKSGHSASRSEVERLVVGGDRYREIPALVVVVPQSSGRREFEERVKGVVEGGVMPVRVAQRPPGGIPLHAGVPVAPSSVTASGPSGRCLGGPAAPPAGSPPLPPSLQALGGGVSNNANSNTGPASNGSSNGNPIGHQNTGNNNVNSIVGTANNVGQGIAGTGLGGGVSTTSGATNPLQAMASAAASLTQLNNMANGPLPPLAATGPTGPPSLPPPQPATTPTHGGPPTPHAGVTGGPHLNGASPSPHPMPPHGMMSGSPHAPHPHMGGGGPSPHPHHPGPHMVGSPHHPGPHPMGPAASMIGAGMQPQGAPGMCGPGPTGPMGPHAHPQGPGVPGQPHMHNDPFYCSPFGSHYFRRHTPYFGQPDYRLYELNKRLQQRTEESDNLWWDAFATEFFEDDATLTLTFCLEDGPKRYTIGRTLIPRYFRSIFEGGVTELYYNLKHPKESFHNTSITLDCDNCVMVTHHGKPMFTKVCTEGRLILEFTFDDLMRIKSWHMSVRTHKELVPRTVVGMQQDPTMLEQLSKNITRQGITNSTLNYLRLCVILEPMQELMSRHKAYALSPRDCLKTTLFQKWQRTFAPPESQRPASKRRKRKGSTSGPGNNAPPAPSKKRSPGPNFSLASQDVMVVGEPSLMGGDFGEEDERVITRLENTQYDATNSLDPHSHDTPGGPPPHPHQFHSEPTPGNSWPPDRGPGPPQGGPGSQGVQGGQGGAAQGVQGTQDASQQQQDKKSPAVSQ